MVDFRKLLLAFAAVALLVVFMAPANAQLIEPAFTCAVTAVPTNVRAEGITELVGDVLLTCTGGTPTAAGVAVPQANVTLGLNTQLTSRLLTGGYQDALMTIDEPFPTTPNPPTATPAGNNVPLNLAGTAVTTALTGGGSSAGVSATGTPCQSNTTGPGSTPAYCNVEAGTFSAANSTAYVPPYQTQPNVFVAHQQDPSHVAWLGVPIDPPGTTRQLVIRLTNIRGNASALAAGSTLITSQIFAFVSVNGSQQISLNQAQIPVAFVFTGLVASTTAASNLQQCASLNVGTASGVSNFFSTTGAGGNGGAVFAVKVTEGFAAAFKRRIYPAPGATIGLNGASADGSQNVPGYPYNTESGYTPTNGTAAPAAFTYGVADTATRIFVSLANVGSGVQIIAPIAVPLTTGTATTGSPTTPSSVTLGTATTINGTSTTTYTGGFLRLVSGSPDVNGNVGTGTGGTSYAAAGTTNFGTSTTFANGYSTTSFGTTSPFAFGLTTPFSNGATVTVSGGSAGLVYEVVNADPNVVETATIPFGVAFTSNTSNNLPATGQSTVKVSFAPLSTVTTATATDPIPRFTSLLPSANTFNINACTCNLLFPFVANQAGYDTGIAIANTSVDPFGTTGQSGTVTLNYYGTTTGGGAEPAAQTSQNVTAGTVLAFTLSGGGNLGINAAAGFEGYIIAQAKFQYCHGFAFITAGTPGGTNGLAEGYLAIQMDQPGLYRTGNTGENLAH